MKSRTAPTLARAYTLGGTLLMSEVLPANATGDVIAARVEERCGLSRKKQLVHPLDSKDPGSLAFVVTVVSEPDLGPLDRAHGFDYPDNPVVGTWTRDTAETTVRISRNFITGRLDYSEPISDVVRLHGFLGPEGFEGSPFFAWSASLRLCRLPTNRDVRRICPCYGACPETIPKPIGRVRLWASGPDSLQVECHADGVADSPQVNSLRRNPRD